MLTYMKLGGELSVEFGGDVALGVHGDLHQQVGQGSWLVSLHHYRMGDSTKRDDAEKTPKHVHTHSLIHTHTLTHHTHTHST